MKNQALDNLCKKISKHSCIKLTDSKWEGWKEVEWHKKDGMKPGGLWYSVGPSWLEWLVSENMYNHDGFRGKYLYRLDIDKTQIKVINTLEKFDAFCQDYKRTKYDFPGMTQELQDLLLIDTFRAIDWQKVKSEFHGIQIAPYFWERRLDHRCSWYYSFDVACGCIWNKEAIKNIKLIYQLQGNNFIKIKGLSYNNAEKENEAVTV